MDELAALPAALGAAFRGYAGAREEDVITNGLHVTRAVDAWVGCLRSAFYNPQRPPKDAAISKFLQLERALLAAFESISGAAEEEFWLFIVHFVITLPHEPAVETSVAAEPSEALTSSPEAPVSPTKSNNCEPKSKRKRKPTRVRAQPNAPLAFVVVSALKKLVTTPGNDANAAICLAQGRENAVLKSFCVNELDPQQRRVDTKLLVELFDLFQVAFVESAEIRALAVDLLASKSHSSLVKLCQTYPSQVDWDFADVMQTMIRSKDWGSAELVAKTFDTSVDQKVLAKVLVEEAINLQDFKRAHRIVYNFGMQHEFPDIDQLYSRDALLKLIEKQHWTLALSFVGSDTALQTLLLTHLVAAREWRHATSLARDRMGMDDFDPEQQARIVEEMAKHGSSSSLANLPLNGYLELPLPDENVVFCDTEDAIRLAAAHFFAEPATEQQLAGLDVEWRPTSTKIASHTGAQTTTAVASILQIATVSKVFLIDLLSLHENEFLFDEFLLKLFQSKSFLKVGFGFDSDLKVLHQTFPERAAFRSVEPFLELSVVVQKALGATVGNSLSNATARILGQPLDKRMQLSNWDERPLSHSQVVYGALDAFCLIQIAEYIQLHSRVDEKSVVTTWDDVSSSVIGSVGLSAPVEGSQSIAELVERRRQYQADWESKLHHHGVIEGKDLLTTGGVQAFWEQRVAEMTSVESDTSLSLVQVQELQPMLAIAEQEPTAYVAVNSICFFADEKPCVACIDSNSKLDTSRLATLCGLSRRKIKLATAMECETIWGFSPGTVPPFAHRKTGDGDACDIPIFVDVTLRDFDKWVTGSGSHDQLLVFSSAAFFARVTPKAVSDIALHRNGASRNHHHEEPHAIGASPPATDGGPIEYKFLTDTMVGRVGRWLRTIGIDVVVWGKKKKSPPVDPSFSDDKSALLALAAREQRIVLTRDKKLADRRDAGACFVVSSDDPHEQFREIKTHFALELKREEMMTRCAVCNYKGFEVVDREYVRTQMRDVVAERVLEIVAEFWKCVACHKIYWEGPKYSSAYEHMLEKFSQTHGFASDDS